MDRIQMNAPRLRNAMLGLLSAACLVFAASVAYVLVVMPESVEAPIFGRFELVDDQGDQPDYDALLEAVTRAGSAG